MAYDAPLLFTSPNPKRQRRVDARINDWREIEIREGPLLPEVITIQTQHAVNNCRASRTPASVAGLSTLAAPNQPLQLPHAFVPRDTLAPVVVFAAALEPADPPDVAVGMALAAHMARADREVSLVVVPHYLESDPELENKLQGQRELVSGGVVLGQTPTVPEETRVLLRQLLTSRDQLGLIAQVQGDLADVETFMTALLALLGASVLVREGPEIKDQASWLIREAGPPVARAGHQVAAKAGPPVARAGHQVAKAVRQAIKKVVRKPMTNGPIPAIADLRIALRDQQHVTIWLRNGWTITGTTGGQVSRTEQGHDPTVTVLRLDNVTLEKAAAKIGTANCVLVPIGDIDLIATGFSNPAHRATTAGNAPADAGDGTALA